MQKPKPVKKDIDQEKLEIIINFKDIPNLYEDLIKAAKMNFRTPEEQILYCVWKQTTPERKEKP